MSCLTTHVLDIAQGRPGRNVKADLYRIVDNQRYFLLSTTSNQDGRCDHPLREDPAFQAGIDELDFHIGDYFAARFIDVVTLHFGVCDADQRYQVPLVAGPWSYSTYRGS